MGLVEQIQHIEVLVSMFQDKLFSVQLFGKMTCKVIKPLPLVKATCKYVMQVNTFGIRAILSF